MSDYDGDTSVRPAAGWYLVPVALWVAAAVIAVIAWKPVIDLVNDGVRQIGDSAAVSVPSDGLTVYATQRPKGGTCTLNGSGGSSALNTFGSNVDWTLQASDGTKFYGLGSTPSNLAPGTYTVQCPGLAQGTALGTGRRIDIGDVARVGVLGFIVPLILGLIGLVVLIVLLVKRHNSKSRIKTARASAAGGHPGTWTGSGYPPPPPSQH